MDPDSDVRILRLPPLATSYEEDAAQSPQDDGGQAAMNLWLPQETHEYPVATFLHDGTRDDKCDINPCTGHLLPPIMFPNTFSNRPEPGMIRPQDMAWRQANMTSELLVSKEIQSRESMAQLLIAKDLERQQLKLLENTSPEEPFPAAQCLVRPAKPQDFAGIAAIINEETQQILEPREVNKNIIQKIHASCRLNKRPFIVAVPSVSQMLSRSKWPEEAEDEYQEYVKFKQAQASLQPSNVLGFAFIMDTRQGFIGGSCFGSRLTGQIKLAVRASHRRSLFGSALLDRILLSTAVYHHSLVDYKWECDEPSLIYEYPLARNDRKYVKLYIETMFEGEQDPQIAWMAKMLEKYQFQQAACFKEALRTEGGREKKAKWLDLVVWELEARPVTEIPNNADV